MSETPKSCAEMARLFPTVPFAQTIDLAIREINREIGEIGIKEGTYEFYTNPETLRLAQMKDTLKIMYYTETGEVYEWTKEKKGA